MKFSNLPRRNFTILVSDPTETPQSGTLKTLKGSFNGLAVVGSQPSQSVNMNIKVVYIESANIFSKREKTRIEKSVGAVYRDTAKTFGKHMPVNFTFYRFGKKLKGFAQAKDWITLTLPKGRIDYDHLESVLYHELHHIVRGYTEYLESGKHFLLNSLFSEGLAMAFEIEKKSNAKRIASCKYSRALLRKWLPIAKKELRAPRYDYQAWFQGKGKPDRMGYRIGKYLVDEIEKHHPLCTHKDLVRKSAGELLSLSKVKF